MGVLIVTRYPRRTDNVSWEFQAGNKYRDPGSNWGPLEQSGS